VNLVFCDLVHLEIYFADMVREGPHFPHGEGGRHHAWLVGQAKTDGHRVSRHGDPKGFIVRRPTGRLLCHFGEDQGDPLQSFERVTREDQLVHVQHDVIHGTSPIFGLFSTGMGAQVLRREQPCSWRGITFGFPHHNLHLTYVG